MKVRLTQAIKDRIKELKEDYQSSFETGSNNFQAAMSKGHLVGNPKYSPAIPHHAMAAGAMCYVDTFDPVIEAALITLLDTDEPIEITGVHARFYPGAGRFVIVVDSKEFPVDEMWLEFTADNSNEEFEEDFNATVIRE